jgi:hypothetical protein
MTRVGAKALAGCFSRAWEALDWSCGQRTWRISDEGNGYLKSENPMDFYSIKVWVWVINFSIRG